MTNPFMICQSPLAPPDDYPPEFVALNTGLTAADFDSSLLYSSVFVRPSDLTEPTVEPITAWKGESLFS